MIHARSVPRAPGPNDETITLRLPGALVARAAALVAFLESRTGGGAALTRSDALRIAIVRGVEVLEAQRDGAKRGRRK